MTRKFTWQQWVNTRISIQYWGETDICYRSRLVLPSDNYIFILNLFFLFLISGYIWPIYYANYKKKWILQKVFLFGKYSIILTGMLYSFFIVNNIYLTKFGVSPYNWKDFQCKAKTLVVIFLQRWHYSFQTAFSYLMLATTSFNCVNNLQLHIMY